MTKNNYTEARKEIRKIFDRGSEYSAEASKIGRQLAFGEGAIFWFFFTQICGLIKSVRQGHLETILQISNNIANPHVHIGYGHFSFIDVGVCRISQFVNTVCVSDVDRWCG